jgi:hypothetical protein
VLDHSGRIHIAGSLARRNKKLHVEAQVYQRESPKPLC